MGHRSPGAPLTPVYPPQWNIRHIRHLYTPLSGTLDTFNTSIPLSVEHYTH